MKKLITSCFASSSIVLSPALKADAPSVNSEELAASQNAFEEEAVGLETPPLADESAAPPEVLATDPANDSEGTPVGVASNEGTTAAKKRYWQNITLATVAVAVAVTALILVASNDGHHSHHHKKK
jgi:hypothetical protein